MLKTETNTPAMARKVLRTAHQYFHTRALSVHFEHGQWWVIKIDTGAAWSVVDATGGSSLNGFDFEQVAEGEEG